MATKLKGSTAREEGGALVAALKEFAHELQTPLAIVKGNLALLARGDLASGERRRIIAIMERAIEELSRLIHHLLYPASHWPEDIAIDTLVNEVYEDCAILAEDRQIALSVALADEPLSFFARGNRAQVKEVLLNLIGNALKYTPRGGSVTLSARQQAATIAITVTDTGIGIAPENLARIFEPFYRIREIASSHPGAGLGLFLCKRIIEAQGGTITVASRPSRGSSFTVHLPAAPSANPKNVMV